jgi:hypothetical protein
MSLLALLWLWNAFVYHARLFSAINPAARGWRRPLSTALAA